MSLTDAKPGSSRKCRNSAAFGEKGEAMSQKQSEQTWDEVLAELDAVPIPDGFVAESERDMRPPQVRTAIEELFDDDDEAGEQ